MVTLLVNINFDQVHLEFHLFSVYYGWLSVLIIIDERSVKGL